MVIARRKRSEKAPLNHRVRSSQKEKRKAKKPERADSTHALNVLKKVLGSGFWVIPARHSIQLVLIFVAGCDGIQRERLPLSVTERLI